MFDVVFISYDEPNADENWEWIKQSVPYAKRIHGIKGIPQAHIEAAKNVTTSHFFTVDGDNKVNPTFDWKKISDWNTADQRIHVWRCKNIVNSLVYGYGGVKLWPTNHIENIKNFSIDFTTSVAKYGFKVQPDIASTTYFNTSKYNAWKSGFREGVKLSGNLVNDVNTNSLKVRLNIWMSVGIDEQFGGDAMLGAREGVLYNIQNHNDEKALWKINDFDWLLDKFNRRTSLSDDKLIANLKKENLNAINFNSTQSKMIKEIMYNKL